MKKLTLLLFALMAGIAGYAAVVQGTVTNMSSTAVPNQIVHVIDSAGGVQIFHLKDTTDAAGHYSITIPSATATGSLLHVYTEKCGNKYTSLQTYSGASLTMNFQVCGTTPTGNQVSGTVTKVTPTGNPAYPAIVYLIHKTLVSGSYVLTLLDSTNTASNGEYHFYGVTYPAGDLLVKCALTPANLDYWNYLPTYKENSLTWSGAHAVSFTLGANDIHMQAGTNPGGTGFIGGSVLLGANKSAGVGDPLEARILLLTTINDDAVAYTFSNASGQFSFPNLAYGTYKLFGDALGKANPISIITLDAAHSTITNVKFMENSGGFSALSVSNPAVFSTVLLYPNPVQDRLTISGLDKVKGTKTVSISGITGAVLASQKTDGATLKIPTAALPSGIYLLQIASEEGSAAYRFMK